MKKVICFPFLASLFLVLPGCGEFNPEVNNENCTDAKVFGMREKFKDDEKWGKFVDACFKYNLKKMGF